MKVLLLIVGLYRAPYAWEASRQILYKANPSLQWDTVLVTNRQPYCNHSDTRIILVNATSFLSRLHKAYALLDWSIYEQSIVLRPDVKLTNPIYLNRVCNVQRTTYIISGDFTRKYIFHNRDWDFGYVVCNTSLFYYFTLNNITYSAIPKLPKGFHGCWGSTCRGQWRYPYMENVISRHLEVGVALRNLDNYNIFLSLRRGKKAGHNTC